MRYRWHNGHRRGFRWYNTRREVLQAALAAGVAMRDQATGGIVLADGVELQVKDE